MAVFGARVQRHPSAARDGRGRAGDPASSRRSRPTYQAARRSGPPHRQVIQDRAAAEARCRLARSIVVIVAPATTQRAVPGREAERDRHPGRRRRPRRRELRRRSSGRRSRARSIAEIIEQRRRGRPGLALEAGDPDARPSRPRSSRPRRSRSSSNLAPSRRAVTVVLRTGRARADPAAPRRHARRDVARPGTHERRHGALPDLTRERGGDRSPARSWRSASSGSSSRPHDAAARGRSRGAGPRELGSLAGVIGLLLLASLGLGLLIAVVSDSERQAVQLSLLTLLASVFFSGFVLAIDQFSPPVRVARLLAPRNARHRAAAGPDAAGVDHPPLAGRRTGRDRRCHARGGVALAAPEHAHRLIAQPPGMARHCNATMEGRGRREAWHLRPWWERCFPPESLR